MCFFKKIQDWILKSERIRKWILRFFTRLINPRSLGSWCVTLEVDFSVPWTHHDPKDLGLICLEKKHKIHFRILSELTIQSWICREKRSPSVVVRRVKVVKASFLSHCFHLTVKFLLSLLTPIALALNQILSHFFCSMINTQIEGCIWFVHGLWPVLRTDLENNTGSRSHGKSGVAKALGLIDRTLRGSATLLDLVCLSERN